MRLASLLFLAWGCFAVAARADLTIVQKIEGAGSAATMTVKIKGDKARVEATPQLATIVDGKSGEMITLLLDQKKIVRVSAKKMKAALDMVNKYNGGDKVGGAAKPKLAATGKKEKINGYDAEEYVYETPSYKATYWVAPRYPDGAAILKQLQALNPELWKANNTMLPDYRDFPGVPIKSIVSMRGNDITTTLMSADQNPINDAEFAPPKDFEEMKIPDIGDMLREGETKPRPKASP
jgi:hypothetical protein